MDVRRLDRSDLEAAVALVSRLQTDPAHHVVYLGSEPEVVAEELAGLGPERLAAGVVARHDDELAGMLVPDWDTDPPRVWWHGPFADCGGSAWQVAADALYAAARDQLPDHVTQEEIAVDARHTGIEAFAGRHGFSPGIGSALLRSDQLPLPAGDDASPGASAPGGLEVDEVDAVPPDVAVLHDTCFPGTHRVGAGLLGRPDEQRLLLVARRAGTTIGYAAVELQPGDEGYLDFVGVTPDARGAGVGRALVAAVSETLAHRGVESLHLTVREDNAAARALYDRLGFTQERIALGYRRGFPHPT